MARHRLCPTCGRTAGSLRTHGLTERQWEYADALASGLSREQVAAKLFVSPDAVKYQATEIHRALGTKSREELVRRVQSLRGIIT